MKKIEGTEILETKITYSKTQKETDRTYTFTKTHQTNKIKFYEYNPENNEKHILIEVDIKEIAKNNYSLNYTEYLKDDFDNEKYVNTNIKTIGDLFNCKMGKFNSNDMDNIGNIPFYSCKSDNPVGYHSGFSFENPEYLLLICAGGSQKNPIGENVGLGKCYYVNGKTACRANVCSLILKNTTIPINLKYIYYYLNINRMQTNKKAKFTTNLGTISLDDIKTIKIIIPSIIEQNELVKNLDNLYEKNKQLEKEIEENKKQAELFITGIVKLTDDTSSVNTEPIDNEVQNEIVSVEEEVIIEPKPKVKKIVKKIKKPLVIVEDNEV